LPSIVVVDCSPFPSDFCSSQSFKVVVAVVGIAIVDDEPFFFIFS